jgi:monofunctional biosynthetic peptidoglycan transglycosylase
MPEPVVGEPAAAGDLDAPLPGGDVPRPAVRRRRRWLRRLLVLVLVVALLPFALTLAYRVVPPVSTLMIGRYLTLQPVTREWVALDDVAPVLVRSLIVSEDARFCEHFGIDTVELQKVLDDYAEGEATRGASTIPMQLAKNLFLWPGRDVLRKAAELPLAAWIDLVLPKARIIEIYLNIAEWGPDGEFGVAAGARRAFGTTPDKLTARQAALLVAILPNPIERNAAKPSRGVNRKANTIAARARQSGGLTDCIFPDG